MNDPIVIWFGTLALTAGLSLLGALFCLIADSRAWHWIVERSGL